MGSTTLARVRVERGIYRQPNGKYAVCWRHAGRLRFRTVGFATHGNGFGSLVPFRRCPISGRVRWALVNAPDRQASG